MNPVEGFLGIGGDRQLAFVLELLFRGGVLVAIAGSLAALPGCRGPGPRRLLWGTALGGALAGSIFSPMFVAVEVPFRIPYAFAYVDNVPHLSGIRAELAGALLPDFTNGGGDARGPGLFAWLFLSWFAGATALTVRLWLGFRRLRVLRAHARPELSGERLELLNAVRLQLGIRREVNLAWSRGLPVPATFGWRRPILLLPHAARRWPLERLRAVFLHELVHVRRHDWAARVMARAACIVYWFNPAIWWASRKHGLAIEAAADRAAARGFGSAAGYARQLLEVTRDIVSVAPRAPALTTSFTNGRDLEGRVREVLRANRDPEGQASAVWLIGPLAAIALLTSFLAPVMGGCF